MIYYVLPFSLSLTADKFLFCVRFSPLRCSLVSARSSVIDAFWPATLTSSEWEPCRAPFLPVPSPLMRHWPCDSYRCCWGLQTGYQ